MWTAQTAGGYPAAVQPPAKRPPWIPWVIAGVALVLALAILAIMWINRPSRMGQPGQPGQTARPAAMSSFIIDSGAPVIATALPTPPQP